VDLPRHVVAHRFCAPEGSILLLHNLADRKVTVDIGPIEGTDAPQSMDERPREVFADGPYARPSRRLTGLELNGYGYRWIRLSRGMPR
jgi:maltose alpha-D-glucosyltransferase / alpha-amylase